MKNSDFVPCPSRQKIIAFHADGSKTPVFRCTEGAAPKGHQDVQPADCKACPLRSKLLASEPLQPHTVDVRALPVDSKPAGFLPCDSRVVSTRKLCCGNVLQYWACSNDESTHYRLEVTPVVCSSCPVRAICPDSGAK
jgi:hypothetical protein